MTDRVREAIEAEKRELHLRLLTLDRLLEQLDHPPTRLPSPQPAATATATAAPRRSYRQRARRSAPETDADRRRQPTVIAAYEAILDDLRRNGGRMEISNVDWSRRLRIGNTQIGHALRFLRDDGLVVRERRGSVGQASIHRLVPEREREVVLEPGVGVREGRRV